MRTIIINISVLQIGERRWQTQGQEWRSGEEQGIFCCKRYIFCWTSKWSVWGRVADEMFLMLKICMMCFVGSRGLAGHRPDEPLQAFVQVLCHYQPSTWYQANAVKGLADRAVRHPRYLTHLCLLMFSITLC